MIIFNYNKIFNYEVILQLLQNNFIIKYFTTVYEG